MVFYNKPPLFTGLCLNYMKEYLKRGGPVFYNKLSWFVSELPKKEISNIFIYRRFSVSKLVYQNMTSTLKIQ